MEWVETMDEDTFTLRHLRRIRRELDRLDQLILRRMQLQEAEPPREQNPVSQLNSSESRKKWVDSQLGENKTIEVFYLTLANIDTIENFADHAGYISHDRHQDFHDLLKELREYRNHVRDL